MLTLVTMQLLPIALNSTCADHESLRVFAGHYGCGLFFSRAFTETFSRLILAAETVRFARGRFSSPPACLRI